MVFPKGIKTLPAGADVLKSYSKSKSSRLLFRTLNSNRQDSSRLKLESVRYYDIEFASLGSLVEPGSFQTSTTLMSFCRHLLISVKGAERCRSVRYIRRAELLQIRRKLP